MPYVPGCEYDLFISYASENNRNCWVEIFKDVLVDELEELLGRQFSRESVFFDKTELRIGQSFPEALERAAEAAAVLVPILSPSYLTSDWCNWERIAFFKKLPAGATQAECFAPVLIRPIDDRALTEQFRSEQSVSFLQPGHSEPWPAKSREWTSRLKKFAEQMKIVLQELRQKCKPVFLGRALPGDKSGVRDLCAMELQKRHFSAGPAELPALDDEVKLTTALKQAVLSVHFIGGANESALRAVEIAAEVCPGATVLYRPYGAKISEDENLWLIEFEKDLKPTTSKYHRLEGKSEQELLLVLEQEITRVQPPAKAALEAALGLICEELDLDLARTLRGEIQERDRLKVAYPDFLETKGTAMERRRKWTELLNSSQALLFCWGKAEQTKRLESLYELAARAKPADRVEWYLSQPNLSEKQQKFPQAICQASDEVRYELLTRFLRPLLGRDAAAP